MTVNDKLLSEISELLVRSMNHDVSDEDFARLQHLLRTDPIAREYYFDLIATFAGVDEIREFHNDAQGNLKEFLQALSDEERLSPAVRITDPKPAKKPVLQKVVYPKAQSGIRKRYVIELILTLAAILMLIVFIRLIPQHSVQVATLTGTLDAEWADSPLMPENGDRLSAGVDSLQLRSGIAAIQFDSGVKVVVEGPVEFMIQAGDRVKLFYGQLYADVPQQAIGFSVRTLNSKIVDLGTEFGVKAEADGTSQVHVLQGKVNLLAGSQKEDLTMQVHEGQAKRISGFSSKVNDIVCNKKLFVRRISAETHSIWRGEKQIRLADIAGGGNGFGTALPDMGIDAVTGQLTTGRDEHRQAGQPGYVEVSGLEFIDGVFVPDGDNGPVQLTSGGHMFDDFGSTNGCYYMPVGSYSMVNMYYIRTQQWQLDRPLELTGYSRKSSDNLCLHANAGITFDLDQIRRSYPFLDLKRFSTVYGVAQTRNDDASVSSDFYVFVDGRPLLAKKSVSVNDEPAQVSYELQKKDRFLTLVCTDGDDNFADWSLFVNPVLEVEAN